MHHTGESIFVVFDALYLPQLIEINLTKGEQHIVLLYLISQGESIGDLQESFEVVRHLVWGIILFPFVNYDLSNP